MMSVQELKESIIRKVNLLDDDEQLQELNALLDNYESGLYEFSPEEEEEVRLGMADEEANRLLTQEESIARIAACREHTLSQKMRNAS